MVVISVYIYGVKMIKKFRWESGFLGGFHETPPPYTLTEVRGTLCSQVLRKSLQNWVTKRATKPPKTQPHL